MLTPSSGLLVTNFKPVCRPTIIGPTSTWNTTYILLAYSVPVESKFIFGIIGSKALLTSDTSQPSLACHYS